MGLGSVLTTIDGGIATVVLPTIARDLKVDGSSAVMVVTVYQLILVMALLPFSALGDRVGLKRMYQCGQLVFTVATALCFFAHSLGFLLIVRALRALGAAGCLSVMSALIRRLYPARILGRGLSFNTLIATSSAVAAPTLGGFILSFASWPWVFAIAAPFGVISLILGKTALPDVPPRAGQYNLAGAMLNVATFGLIIGGLEALVHGNSPIVSLAIVAIGVLLAVLMVRHERDEPFPILPVDLLARPVLALSVAGAFLCSIGSQTLLLSTPFRLQHSYGLTPAQIGAMLAAWPLTTLVVAPLAGYLSDRYPAGLMGGIGMAIGTVGFLSLGFLPPHPDLWDMAWRLSLCGVGTGSYMAPNARLVIGSAPKDRAASAGGLVSTTRLVGQTTGATLVATLLALGLGTTTTPPFLCAGLGLITCLCSFARLRPSIRNPGREETVVAHPTASET